MKNTGILEKLLEAFLSLTKMEKKWLFKKLQVILIQLILRVSIDSLQISKEKNLKTSKEL